LNRLAASTFKRDKAVLSYFHPYDVDVNQERFMHPHLNDSKLLNWLMYNNRSEVFAKAESLMKNQNAKIMRYDQYLATKIKS
jgi:hypothetical protein